MTSSQGLRVELAGISKRYGSTWALRGVDLAIDPGTVHALVGENGAGKSTLGKVISGATLPSAGEVRVDGEPVVLRSPRAGLDRGIARMAQELALVPHRTVLENVLLGNESQRYGLVRGRDQLARYSALCESVGFTIDPWALVSTLRVADQQKVEILRAVARRARLIVMDEPTAALSTDDARRLLDVVRDLRTRGTTVVFVSHFLEHVLEVADTVTVMRDGAIARTARACEETASTLVTAMLGRELSMTFPPKRPSREPEVLLSVRGLRALPEVVDVSFDLRAGEILGVAGLVGSGRSETARALFGADHAHAEGVTLCGREGLPRNPRKAIRTGLALVPEDRKRQGLVLCRSIAENVTLPHVGALATGGFVKRREAERKAATVLQRVDVRGAPARRAVAVLSGGNQQKALFGKWLLRQPRVLIADEPTRGVDLGAKAGIYQLLVDLAAEGMGVIVISSELEEVCGLAHRILVMRQGRTVTELPGDAPEEAIMQAAFGSAPVAVTA